MENIIEVTNEIREFKNKKLTTATKKIIKYSDGIKANLISIACELKKIKEEKLYEEDGYTSISDYAEKVLGYSRANTSKMVNVGEKFLDRQNNTSIFIEDKKTEKDFSLSQLTEMLPLTLEESKELVNDEIITADMSSKAIRETVKEYKKPKKEEIKNENESESESEKIETSAVLDNEEIKAVIEEVKEEDDVKRMIIFNIEHILELLDIKDIETAKEELINLNEYVTENL